MAYLPLWMDGLTPDMKRKAEEELGETPQVKAQALMDLKRRISDEADFSPKMEDAFLLRFLRVKKYNVPKAFETLKNYYIFKYKYSGVYMDFTPNDLRKLLDMKGMLALPKRLTSGTPIAVFIGDSIDMSQTTANDVLAAAFLCAELTLLSEATQVCGLTFIIDLGNMSLTKLLHFASPTLIASFFYALQDCSPARLKAIHFVKEPWFFSLIYNIAKRFMTQKVKSRMFFHGSNLETLHEHIPPEILPEELGGKAGPVSSEDFCKKLFSMESHFADMKKYGFKEKHIKK